MLAAWPPTLGLDPATAGAEPTKTGTKFEEASEAATEGVWNY